MDNEDYVEVLLLILKGSYTIKLMVIIEEAGLQTSQLVHTLRKCN